MSYYIKIHLLLLLLKKGVVFTDGTIVDNVDVIIYGTGYQTAFPVLERNTLIDTANNRLNLYKFEFDPQLSKQTLAIIGCFQPVGALMPISDLQCRLAVRVFLGELKLPGKEDMYKAITDRFDGMKRRYYSSNRHTIQVDPIPFGDGLAELIDCRPNLLRMFFTDPRLALQCFFGPLYPQQYRLKGPGKWAGAREFIMNAHKDTYIPMYKRKEEKRNWTVVVYLTIIFLMAAVVLKFLN